MDRIKKLVEGLRNKAHKYAYECLKQLEHESGCSSAVYAYFDTFAEMLDDANSYIRTRGAVLISANVKWDSENKIDGIIEKLLGQIMDDKPITARQCIRGLPLIVKYRPDLKGCIVRALRMADVQKYKSGMRPLICKDIENAMETIAKIELKG